MHGRPSGFIYVHDNTQNAHSQLAWALLAGKHMSKSLHTPCEGGRTFFLAITQLDGGLGYSPSSYLPSDVLQGQQAAVFGLCKTLAQEWEADVFCRGIDLSPQLSVDKAAGFFLQEMSCSDSTLREVAYDSTGARLTSTSNDLNIPPAQSSEASSRVTFTADDVVIVTGGARGITPLCVAALARRVEGGVFFLLGRSAVSTEPEPAWANGKAGKELEGAALGELKRKNSLGGPKPTIKDAKKMASTIEGTREVTESLTMIKRQGGVAHYFACDTTSASSVAQCVRSIHTEHKVASITGVIHAAGVLADKKIENKPPEDFDMVWGVKINGLKAVLEALRPSDLANLRHLILFSSLAGFHGNVGQSDYSMANDALSKIAIQFSESHPSCNVRSLCFGPWDGGMVTPALKAHFQSQGVQIIPRSEGANQVAALITIPGEGRTQCLIGNWGLPPAMPKDSQAVIRTTLFPPNSDVSGNVNNSFLLSHVLKGKPVLPMTMAVGWMATVVERLYPGFNLKHIEDCTLFGGITLDKKLPVQLDLIRLNPSNSDVVVQVTLNTHELKLIPAYKAKVVLCSNPVVGPGRVSVASSANATSSISRADLYNGRTLFHGPFFQHLQQVLTCTNSQLVGKCVHVPLASVCEYGQFGPAKNSSSSDGVTADVALQAMLVWARLIHRQASLPKKVGKFEFFRRIPAGSEYFIRLDITNADAKSPTGNCVFYDASGEVFFRGIDLQITLSPSLEFGPTDFVQSGGSHSLSPSKGHGATNSFRSPSARGNSRSTAASSPTSTQHLNGSAPADNHSSDSRIAVVGMALTYAGAPNKERFWELLMENRCAIGNLSPERLASRNKTLHHSKDAPKYADTFVSDRYGVVDSSIATEHDLLLSLARSALQDAQRSRSSTLNGLDRCGIVSGCLSFPRDEIQAQLMPIYQAHVERELGHLPELSSTAAHATWGSWFPRRVESFDTAEAAHFHLRSQADPATYAAEVMGLTGNAPRYCLDAACASALYALKLAQDHLVRGEADVMLCGASCLPEPFFILSGFSTFRALPFPHETSAPFDRDSKGLAPSEGGAVMVLKRLSDAIRDGDYIYGTLLGVGVNNSGQGMPLKPHEPSELGCMRDTYSKFGLDPASIQYVECHATGTPQGDQAEIGAVRECFGPDVKIGSTKGTFGHSLVAAGFAGMCKLLLSMRNNIIPATINVNIPLDANVVMKNMSWPSSSNYLKRGGLNAFGFGGTNAHAIFEEYSFSRTIVTSSFESKQAGNVKIGIVGMAARFGTLDNLTEFERAIYNGSDGACDLPEKRWRFLSNDAVFRKMVQPNANGEAPVRGCFIKHTDTDYKRLGLPRLVEDQLLPQQLVAIATIDQALCDANSGIIKGRDKRVAVLVGLGTDMELYRHRARIALRERMNLDANIERTPEQEALVAYVSDAGTSTSYTSNIGNLIATRISALWGFTGPSFTVTQGANSVFRCVQLAKGMLLSGEVDAVVVAGVDLCGSAEAIFQKVHHGKVNMSNQSSPRIGFEESYDGFFVGEGSGALILRRLDEDTLSAERKNVRVYAKLDAIVEGPSVESSVAQALTYAGRLAHEIEMVEVSSESELANKELSGLVKAYAGRSAEDSPKVAALGSATATIGHCGYASGAASLIKTALCLYNRYLPVLPRYVAPMPVYREMLETSSFYICPESRAWMKNPGHDRIAAVSGVSRTNPGSCFHAILSGVPNHYQRENIHSLDPSVVKLLVLRAVTNQALVQVLRESKVRAESNPVAEFRNLLRSTIETANMTGSVLALVTNAQKLVAELSRAVDAVLSAKVWNSPSGSFFTPNPLRSDKVAFMYGDAATAYVGLGQHLHRIAPELHEKINDITTDMWSKTDESWNSRDTVHTKQHQAARVAEFGTRQVDMFRSGVYHAICFTHIASAVGLGVVPKAAFGLSMGEITMYFSFGRLNSRQSNKMVQRLYSSPVWNEQLSVDFKVLRNAWHIESGAPVASFWQGNILHATKADIEVAIQNIPCVRLLIVNDNNSCLVAGKPESLELLREKLNCKWGPVSQGLIGHCPEVEPFASEIARIHDFIARPAALHSDPEVKLFTNVGCVPLETVDAKTSLGELISQVYIKQADFPKLVRSVAAHDYDVFIEVGAGDARAQAVTNILKNNGRPFVSVAMDCKVQDTWHQILRSAAVLIGHQVPNINLKKLYHSSLSQSIDEVKNLAESAKFVQSVVLNGRFVDIRKSRGPAPAHFVSVPLEVKGEASTKNPGGQCLAREIEYQREQGKKYKGPLLWDFDDLLVYAEGDIAPVFNKHKSGIHPDWSLVDTFSRRVRLPQREYLLCSRVCSMNATTNVYEPCTMTTEYDLPYNGELSEGGDVPWAVLVESGQCDLMLISYLGIDFQCKGNRVYRLLDTTLTFFGVALEGETLRYDIKINSFAKKGEDVTMFFFEYNCYVAGRLLIEMRNGVAGFFTEQELAEGKGVVRTAAEEKQRQNTPKKSVEPFMISPATKKTSFSEADMEYLCNHGKSGWGRVISTAQDVRYKLCSRKMLMIDRITHIDPRGGIHGLGLIIGEKILDPKHWYFPCHFKGDEVMAGSLVSDGCSQLLKVYLVWLGIHRVIQGDIKFRPVNGQSNKVRCRGQISPHVGKLVYVMEIYEIGYAVDTGFPYAKANVDIIDVDFAKGQSFEFSEASLNLYGKGDLNHKIVVDFKGIALQLEGIPSHLHPTMAPSSGSPVKHPQMIVSPPAVLESTPQRSFSSHSLETAALVARLRGDTKRRVALPAFDLDNAHDMLKIVTNAGRLRLPQLDESVYPVYVPVCTPKDLGDVSFMHFYNVDYPIYTGAMAKGIASAALVIAAGQRRMLASFGAGGLPLSSVETALDQIQTALPNGPYAVNLIHSPFDDHLEKGCVELLLRREVTVVEASAFMSLTPHLVRYRVAGLSRGADGRVQCKNKVIFKLSRTELANMAFNPAPQKILDRLVAEGYITPEQVLMAREVPMADDVAVEADSGGHTDNRPIQVILPLIISDRDRLHRELKFDVKGVPRVRVGAGGGIGCPASVMGAFAMGAAFVVTGTINQLSLQANTCNDVREQLSKAAYSDVTMAPAADMFDEGVQLQVLKKGTQFPGRAKKLFEYYHKYKTLDALEADGQLEYLEKKILGASIEQVWNETKDFYINRLHDEDKIKRVEAGDKPLKMSLCFRWYLSKSSGWANRGESKRKMDYQVWCGPAIGTFNSFIKGSFLDKSDRKSEGKFPDVFQINAHLLQGACYLSRRNHVIEQLKDLRREAQEDVSLAQSIDACLKKFELMTCDGYRPEGLL